MAAIFSWLLYKTASRQNNQIIHLEFRQEVTIVFLRIKPRKGSVRPGPKIHTSVPLKKIEWHYLIETSHIGVQNVE